MRHAILISAGVALLAAFAPGCDGWPVGLEPEPPECGNGVAEEDEQCDGLDVRFARCDDVLHDRDGIMGCHDDCTWDPSDCVFQCGDGILDPDEECDRGLQIETPCTTLDPTGWTGGTATCGDDCLWNTHPCIP